MTSIAERLGYPADAKLLIIHGDDVGLCESVNAANFAALELGAINSASIMMPAPAMREAIELVKEHPNADIGLHLTLTSEWSARRWGSIAPKHRVPSLWDVDGGLFQDVGAVTANATVDDVERELSAQIELALSLGVRPTHLDSHMLVLFSTPAFMSCYARVARAHRIPYLNFLRAPHRTAPPDEFLDIVLDRVMIALPSVPRNELETFYLNVARSLPAGVSELIVHLGHDDAELRAITSTHEPYGAAWRQADYDVVTGSKFTNALRGNDVVLVTWAELGAIAYGGVSDSASSALQ